MEKATHNSGTGESPKNFWAKYFSFCAKCQNKTIEEQYRAGVRLFDIRIRKLGYLFYVCHGLAVYEKTLFDVLGTLDAVHAEFTAKNRSTKRPIVMITYEGSLDSEAEATFISIVKDAFKCFPKIKLGYVSVKKPTWRTILRTKDQPEYIQNYPKLTGWKALLPFPALWNHFKKNVEGAIVMEDFV